MQNTENLIKLIAKAKLAGGPDSIIRIINDVLYVSNTDDLDNIRDKILEHNNSTISAFSLNTGKTLSHRIMQWKYQNFIRGNIFINKNMQIGLPMPTDGIKVSDPEHSMPLSYGAIRQFDAGKYKIVTFTNDLHDTEYTYRYYGTVKNLVAVLVLNKENNKIVYFRDDHDYPIFDTINHAIWYFDIRKPNTVELVIVHPDRIERKKMSFDQILLPDKFQQYSYNYSKVTATDKQYGILVRKGTHFQFLTVINKKLVSFKVPLIQSFSMLLAQSTQGFKFRQIKSFIVSNKSYFFDFMIKNSENEKIPCLHFVVKHNMDNYIDDDSSLVFTSLLDKKGNKEVFLIGEKDEKEGTKYINIVLIDTKKKKKYLLYNNSIHDYSLFYARAHIGKKHLWLFTEKEVVPRELFQDRFTVYDVETGSKVYTRENGNKSASNFYMITSAKNSKSGIVFFVYVDNGYDGKAIVLNTETMESHKLFLKNFFNIHYKNWDVIYTKDAVLLGYWNNEESVGGNKRVYQRHYNRHFAVCYILDNKKVYSLTRYSKKGTHASFLFINNPYILDDSPFLVDDHNDLASSLQ